MFRSKSNLAKGLLLLLVASWCAGCGADKPPESELDPAHIGVNFWSSAMAEEEGEDQMFAPDQNAYVLLQAGEDNHHIGDVVGAGLRPIFRFDAWGKAVPQCIYGGAICTIDDNRESCDDCNHWSMAFARFIAQVNGVDPDDAGASDDPVGLIQELENVVFVVGNEPWLDGGIRLRDYAAAYSVIWRAVHLDKDDPQYTQENPRFPSIRLLVAGQNFHAQGSLYGEEDTVNTVTWPGLVSQQIWDNGTDVDGYAIHTYGYGSDNPDPNSDCDRPDKPCEIETGWPGDDSFLNYQDQIDFEALADEGLLTTDFAAHFTDKPVYITEFNTNASGDGGIEGCQQQEDCDYVPSQNYPEKSWWIVRAANVVADDDRVAGLVWYVGAPHGDPDWRYFALSEDYGMLPCARHDFRYVSGVGEAASPDCSPDNQVPIGGSHLLWDECNCVARANRTFVWGLDLGGSGLHKATVACSPPMTYDLSGTESGVFYASVIESVPPEGGTCTITVYDGAGNYTEQTLYNPGSIQIPGCDNPDDNHSAASSESLPTGELLALPQGARPTPKIAVLSGGFAGNLMQVLLDVGEPAVLVGEDFDPSATVAQYPVLLIPSGGLYGRENSTFRARLEEYARQGGTIIVFAQQHGYEYGALPGGEVGGYGWNRDIACFQAAFEMENWHPMLAGLEQDTVDVHVDGYFTTWPGNAQILLSRTANGYPGVILYPFEEGRVLATNIYDDWGSANGQIAPHARILLRDLLSWAILPPGSEGAEGGLPQYAVDEPVAFDIQVANTSPYTATAVSLRLVDPARQIVSEHTITITVPAGAVASVPFTTTAAAPHGIWRVDASLMASEFYRLTRDVQVARYAVIREFPDAGSSDTVSLSVSAPSDTFPRGSVGVFTFRVQNHTGLTQTVDVRWERDQNCREGTPLAEDILVSPMDEVALQLELPVWDTFRLRGCAIGDDFVTNDSHPVILTIPQVEVALTRDRAGYVPGDPVALTTGLTNTTYGRLPLTLDLEVLDSHGQSLHTAASAVTLPAAGDTEPGTATRVFHFTLPLGNYGTATAALTVRDATGRAVGGQQADLHVVPTPLAFEVLPPSVNVGVSSALDVNVTNLSPVFDVTDGTLSLTLKDPGDATIASGSTSVALDAGATTAIQLDIALSSLQFGNYVAHFGSSDEYGSRLWVPTWPSTPYVTGLLDAPTYRAGDIVHLDLRLVNPGPFVLPLTATLSADLAYSDVQFFTLAAYDVVTLSLDIPVPLDVEPDGYPVILILTLPGGDAVTQTPAVIQVPPSDLAFADVSLAAVAGQAASLTIANEGGVPTVGEYELALRDATGRVVLETGGWVEVGPGQRTPVAFTVPAGATSGQYYLHGQVTDGQTDVTASVVGQLQITGLTTLIEAHTDRETYATDEMIGAGATITNQGTALADGDLTLRIVRRQGDQWPVWDVYNTYNSGLTSNRLRSVAVDRAGNVWFGHHEGESPPEAGRPAGMAKPVRQWEEWTVDMLSADLETWNAFELPLAWASGVSDIAVDRYNRKWFATDRGVARLSANNETWETYTAEDTGLVSDWVNSVAVDDDGNAWFGTEEGVSLLTSTGVWTTYTTFNSDLLANWVHVVAVDDEQNVWFGTWNGLNKLTPDGTWSSFTAEDSGLLSDYVVDIAFDEAGDVWLATPGDEGGVSVLLSDGSWMAFTPFDSGLSSEWNITAIAVDTVDRVWVSYGGNGVDVLLADRITWTHYEHEGGAGAALSSDIVNDIAVAPNGDVWLATTSDDPWWEEQPSGGATHNYTGDPWPIWDAYDTYNSGAVSNWVESVAIDGDGNVWFGHNDEEGGGGGSSRPAGLAALRYQWEPGTIAMLSADLETWDAFELPLNWPSAVSDIAVDRYNRKWFTTDRGVARLSADNETWETYTAEDSGLASDWVNSVAVDDEGNAWFGAEEGVSLLTSTGVWTTYTTFNSDLLANWVYVVAVDDEQNVWIGTAGGLNKLTPDGTWSSFTAEDSDLLSDYVVDIAFDEAGSVWLATPGYEGGVSVLHRDHTWTVYTPLNSDLSDQWGITAIAVDAASRTWIGYDGYDGQGVDVLLADGVTWMHHGYEWEAEEALSGDIINDVATALNGEVWLATQPWGPWGEPDGGVTHVRGAGLGEQVLWARELSVDLDSPDLFDHESVAAAASLRATGKLYLETELTSPTGQDVAYDEVPFYVFPGSMILRLDAAPSICRPGQTITLTAEVQNTGAVTLTERALIVSQDYAPVHVVGPFDLSPGEHITFLSTLAAPYDADATVLEASMGEIGAVEVVQIGEPAVSAAVSAPVLVGRQPFSFTVMLNNTGRIDAQVEAMIDASDPQIPGLHTSLTIPAGESRLLQPTYQVRRDTRFTITLSGDLARTLVRDVVFGEAVVAIFSPQPVYLQGDIAIPYTFVNTGQLPTLFTATVSIQSLVSDYQFHVPVYLPPGETVSGNLSLDLPVGEYSLTYATPFDSGIEAFRVASAEAAEISATVGPRDGSIITVVATATNTGFGPLAGTLRLETAFFSADHPVYLPSAVPQSYDLPLNTATAAPGTYPASLTLLGESGLPLASTALSVTVPGADLILTTVPTGTLVRAGQWVTLTFGVANQGSAPDTAVISVTLGNLVDEAQSVWLPGGDEGALSFSFRAPEGLSGEWLTGNFWFEGQRYDLSLPISGVTLDVAADWDQIAYAPGTVAVLSLSVTNLSESTTPPLYAHIAYHNQVITRPLTLAGDESVVLDFPLVALVSADADPKVFYGIYEAAERRSVYLNTTYLYVRDPEVTVVPDRPVYLPGDTVQATIVTTATGTLTVTAPGFSSAIQLPATGFQFILPADLLRGTYAIDYVLDGGLPRSTPFDVSAVQVRVTEARSLDLPYAPGDDVQAELTVASSAPLDVAVRAWLLYPDGTRSAPVVDAASLQDILNNRISVSQHLSTTQAGPHSLVYWLTDPADPDRVHASGLETFDVGAVVILGLHTDRREYPHTNDPVTAEATLLAAGETSALIEWQLDGATIASQTANLVAGTQPLTLLVPGPLTPGWHVMQARVSADSLSDEAETRFLYATAGPDLLVGRPFMYKPSALTTTIHTYVYNRGKEAVPATTLHLYDGDPAEDGELIAEVTAPPLPAKDSAYQDTEEFLVTWELAGLAGPHTLYAVADADDVVQEIREDNNTSSAHLEVPRFSLAVSTDKETYERGDPVNITVRVINLQASGDLSVGLTTTVNLLGWKPFQAAEPITVPASTLVERQYTWAYAATRGGEYTVRAEAVGEMGAVREHVNFFVPHAAEFVATPLSGTSPLTVTFTDLSSPWGWVDSWLWDFGDGSPTVTETNPVHVYTTPGSYAVTLTTTVGISTYVRVKPGYITVVPDVTACELYPIGLHVDTVAGAEMGQELEDIYNGGGPGNFGWLTWTGSPSVRTLVTSLTPPGDSDTYTNPYNPDDDTVSVGDWVQGKPGLSNAKAVRNALDNLKSYVITVPVWDEAVGEGNNLEYHVVGFARVQITDYRLPGQDRISAIFLGTTTCPDE